MIQIRTFGGLLRVTDDDVLVGLFRDEEAVLRFATEQVEVAFEHGGPVAREMAGVRSRALGRALDEFQRSQR